MMQLYWMIMLTVSSLSEYSIATIEQNNIVHTLVRNNISSGINSAETADYIAAIGTQNITFRNRNISNENSGGPLTNIFFGNYQSQQNVVQLMRNIDSQLRNLRNVEMRVTKIQEIFDSMQFGTISNRGGIYKNYSEMLHKTARNALLEEQLKILSNRLSNKLQKASEVVYDLRDFFRLNLTKLSLEQHLQEVYRDYEDIEIDTDADFDYPKSSENKFSKFSQPRSIYLSTFVQPCQNSDYIIEQNYNEQQIQILNFLKTEETLQNLIDSNYLLKNNKYTLEANILIMKKLQMLKAGITQDHKFAQPGNNTTNVDNSNNLKMLESHFKHIYFLSRSDHASDRNENFYYDLHFRKLYVSAILRKYVFLLVDVGSAMNAELLDLAKTYIKNILQLLSDTDRITIVTIADNAKTMTLNTNISDNGRGVYAAKSNLRDHIVNFVNNLRTSKDFTNHSRAFEHAFQLLHDLKQSKEIGEDNPIQFVYITRGFLTNLSEAVHVLQAVANGQSKLQVPVVINTCLIVLDEKRIMYEKQFLNDISLQNFSKYNINIEFSKMTPDPGQYIVISKKRPETIIRATTAIFKNSFETRYLSASLEVHRPTLDKSINTEDAIVSVTHAVAPFGVIGVNLYLSDLIEDITNYEQQHQSFYKNEYSYAFLISRNGGVITHPAYPRQSIEHPTPFPVDISCLENSTNFAYVRHKMLYEERGTFVTTIYLTIGEKSEIMDRTYKWQSVLGFYIVCIVATTKKQMQYNFTSSTDFIAKTQKITTLNENMRQYENALYDTTSTMDTIVYHRLDITAPPNIELCRYFRLVSTIDATTLFLSAGAFDSPFTFLHNNRVRSQQAQIRTIENIMAYIRDNTGLIANPGLRPQIRQEVNSLYNAMQHLKKRHQDSRGNFKNYIIRRYIATLNGVLQMYPGCVLSSNYDPTRRTWFRKAMKQPGKIITTPPYLDAGGAGYVITLAHTIFEGKSTALHSIDRDQPVAVVALDLPYTFYYKIILDTTPLCQLNNIKCLLFEDEGYLVAHPSMLEPSTTLENYRRPYEHLTHKESYLVNDILNHKTLVRKLACAIYQNRTVQRYYKFNTSLTDIVTNVVQAERIKYAISLVRGSNIFATVLNSTCDGGAFCPCSTIDRMCLNCNRMDQGDCECPCECPMEVDTNMEATFMNYSQPYAYCQPSSDHFVAVPTSNAQDILHNCFNINCEAFGTQNDCLAILGCTWCQLDLDGNIFASAFCTGEFACFNGILSSLTPYGDIDDLEIISAHSYNPNQKPNSYSAFGPVGGAVVVLGIIIGFAIYCYRHNIDTNAQDQFYIDSMQEENYGLPLSRFNFDDCQALDDPPVTGGSGGYDHPGAQCNSIHPIELSPYHMSTGSSYRRPPNGESDHGYSTMTPHEDSSDHQCFVLAEPLLMHEKRNSKSDTLSISTSISSPTNRNQQHYHQHPHRSHFDECTNSLNESRHNQMKANLGIPSSVRTSEQTVLPLHDNMISCNTHFILAPVTVHQRMEISES